MSERGGPGVGWSAPGDLVAGVGAVDAALAAVGEPPLRRFSELDAAIEWCEDELLAELEPHDAVLVVPLEAHEIATGLTADDLARLASALDLRRWVSGELVVRAGQPARELFLVSSGTLSVSVSLTQGSGSRRLSTLSAGMVFGELAFLGSERRTADVMADTEVRAWVLDADRFKQLGERFPVLRAAILENLLRIVARTARRMTDEIALLAG